MKRLLLLMGTETYRARDFLAAAKRLDVDLIVGTDQPQAVADLSPERFLTLDFLARDEAADPVLAQIAAKHAQRPLDAIVSVDDEALALAARASEALGLPTNSLEATVSATNKRVFREIAEAAGLRVPWYRTFPLSTDPARAARQVRYPCVLKPLFLNASRGVIRADNATEFVAAFERIAALLDSPDLRAKGGDAADALLVEGYLPGAEVALEGMINAGAFHLLAFFDKPEPMEGPYFEETLYITPSRHPAPWQAAAVRAVSTAAAALGLRTGPVHAELRLDGGEPFLLELAPRSIGGHCSRTLRFGGGMSLEEIILRQALGLATGAGTSGQPEREMRASGVMMLPIPAAGRLNAVVGLEAALAVPGIREGEITIPLTRQVVPLPEGRRYLGFLFAEGDTPEAVEQTLRHAHSLLHFDIG